MSLHRLLPVFALVVASHLAGAIEQGKPFPDLGKFGMEGSVPRTSGKVVLVDFWASWCAPCKKSFPVLDSLNQRYRSQGFVVVGVNVDDDPAAMQRFLKAHAVSFPVVRDAKHQLAQTVHVPAMPTSFLLDRSGVVRLVTRGFHAGTEAALQQQIERLLKGAK